MIDTMFTIIASALLASTIPATYWLLTNRRMK